VIEFSPAHARPITLFDFERGKRHSKGNEHGMTALTIQVTELRLPGPEAA
jgi:hypothetical protein